MKTVKMQRVGIQLPLEPLSELINLAKSSEKNGFASAWIYEYYQDCSRDAFITAASIALATNLQVATNVINPYTRSPAIIAMNISTLDELSSGRMILGIGTSIPPAIENQGLKFQKPLVALRECVEIVRGLLRGETVTYEGKVHRLKEFKLDFKPLRPSIPVYLAAIREKSLRLAGQIADGVILSGASSKAYVKHALTQIRKGAREAGRELEDVDIACIIYLSAMKDEAKARQYVKEWVAQMLAYPGIGEELIDHSRFDRSFLETIRTAWKERQPCSIEDAVTDDMAQEFAVTGSPEQCYERLEEYCEAGVNLPLFQILNPDVENNIKTIGEWIKRNYKADSAPANRA